MKFNFLYFIIIFVSFKFILNGDPVSELKADEETESDCYKTANPQSKNDCLEREVAEGDSYCCLFEIETHKKKTEKRCSGLTSFQYNHIKLYVKEKMDELLYRNFHIHCNSLKLKNKLFIAFIFLSILFFN